MPFFRDVAVGCYVRVGIGAHEGRMVYRVRDMTHTHTHIHFVAPACPAITARFSHFPSLSG